MEADLNVFEVSKGEPAVYPFSMLCRCPLCSCVFLVCCPSFAIFSSEGGLRVSAIFRSSSAAWALMLRSSSSLFQTPVEMALYTSMSFVALASSFSWVAMTFGMRSSAERKF